MRWFEIALVGLTFLTGLVWLVDKLWLRKRREERAGILEPKEPILVDYSRAFFPVLAAVLCLRSFVAEPFRIPSSSMMPTLLIGDFILVNKFAYGLRLPALLCLGAFAAWRSRFPSGSLRPRVLSADFSLANKFAPGVRLPVTDKEVSAIGGPERGNVLGSHPPMHPEQDWSKRVVGLPG